MEVSVENQADIARKITITVEAELFDEAVKSQLARYAKDAKLAGFRKGKVPPKIIEQQFGSTALKDGVDGLINEHYPKALQQEKIVPAGTLSITPTQVERGKDFVFEVEIEVYPEINKPDLKGNTIEQIDVSVGEADIDRTLANIQKRQTQYTETDKKAAEGDQLIIDFIGTIDGETFGGGANDNAELVLGEGRFMQAFESNLKGSSKGDKKTFDVKFPKDYHGVEVAGKTAQFEVTVKQVNVGSVPDIDEAFAKNMGVEGGIKAMRADIKLGLEREMQQKLRANIRDQVMNAISEKYDFSIPQAPVEEEIKLAMAEVTKQLEQQGMPSKGMINRDTYEAPSKQRVKLGLLIRAVVEAEDLSPTEELIEARARELAAGYAEPEQYVQHALSDENQRNQIASIVLEEQVIEHLLQSAKIKKVEKSYEAFMLNE